MLSSFEADVIAKLEGLDPEQTWPKRMKMISHLQKSLMGTGIIGAASLTKFIKTDFSKQYDSPYRYALLISGR